MILKSCYFFWFKWIFYRDNTIFKEQIEIKKVYQHPSYVYPKLYNDIAVVELGRRIVYDFKKFGDTPTCLDQQPDFSNKIGKLATVQVDL